jgi:hypothetical protein
MFACITSLLSVGQVLQPALTLPHSSDSGGGFLSVSDYDKQKNCTTDRSKRPTSIEYLTHFNCGRVSIQENGQTVSEFILVVEENQNVNYFKCGTLF